MAVNNLAWLYLNGLGCQQDLKQAIENFKESAYMGFTTSMVNLGNIFEEAKGYEAAFYWYHEAAILGNPKGLFNYAICSTGAGL